MMNLSYLKKTKMILSKIIAILNFIKLIRDQILNIYIKINNQFITKLIYSKCKKHRFNKYIKVQSINLTSTKKINISFII